MIYLLRKFIAHRHRHDAGLRALQEKMQGKNLLATLIYLLSIPLAWVSVPVAIGLIVLPAIMYFRPDHRVEQRQSE